MKARESVPEQQCDEKRHKKMGTSKIAATLWGDIGGGSVTGEQGQGLRW
ncbi:hypothetical protein SBDP1_540027 [Syntrophobacter sp. SbD1]|nr:hypothetical protein SBDP1_540027 [Syntrophobacter sp. SbD1]